MDEKLIVKKLLEHDKRFDDHDKRFDRITSKLIEHDHRFQEMLTKAEFHEFKDQIMTGMDKMLVILQRLDQERIFTNQAIQRIQKQIDEQQKDILRIKKVLKLA
jgi:hypothetical protein